MKQCEVSPLTLFLLHFIGSNCFPRLPYLIPETGCSWFRCNSGHQLDGVSNREPPRFNARGSDRLSGSPECRVGITDRAPSGLRCGCLPRRESSPPLARLRRLLSSLGPKASRTRISE